MLEDLTFKSFGVVNYHETLDLMKSHIQSESFTNEIWLLEHPPIFTLGTAADRSHILNAKKIPVVQSDRGGEVTYHCLLYTSPSPRDRQKSRMPSSA